MSQAFELYTSTLTNDRVRFDKESAIAAILDPHIDPTVLELFWIYFNSVGVGMTEPVEGWIHRAGERCIEMGLTDLGRSLVNHAKQEAGHQIMMIADTKTLVSRWNARHTPQLDAEWFLSQPTLESVKGYTKLHEDVIASDAPYGQVAIEYEIEMFAVRYGDRLLEQSKRLLSETIIEGLTFLEEHTTLDIGHTQLNEKMLRNLLEQQPERVTILSQIGGAALEAYGAYLNQCLSLAQAHQERLNQENLVYAQ